MQSLPGPLPDIPGFSKILPDLGLFRNFFSTDEKRYFGDRTKTHHKRQLSTAEKMPQKAKGDKSPQTSRTVNFGK